MAAPVEPPAFRSSTVEPVPEQSAPADEPARVSRPLGHVLSFSARYNRLQFLLHTSVLVTLVGLTFAALHWAG